MGVRGDHLDHPCPACLFVVDPSPIRAARIRHALKTSRGRALRVTVVSAAADALRVTSGERVRAVLVEHRTRGVCSERAVRALVDSARGQPVVWLIGDDEVVEISEAVAAGVSGAFYWDQLGPDLLSIIDRLALRGSSKPEVHSTGAYRIASGRRGDRVSADAAMLRGQPSWLQPF